MADAIMLDGRVALITGGGGAIGSATARLMRARGARIAVADIDGDRARAVAEELGGDALAIAVDLEDEAATMAMVDQTVAHFGRLDILHNNALFSGPESVADIDVETMDTRLWDRSFAVNVRSPMIACRQALPHLVATGAGAIVNTASVVGMRGAGFKVAYAASKAALIQLTRAIAASHGRRGVRCNAVAPGMTLHPAAEASMPKEFLDRTRAETPRPRLGLPDDIAQVVAFLASDAARHLTGHLIAADGGLTMHLPGGGELDAALEIPGA
jgi:NAD(P)-dependent dehydrogenase (short-subunit alcohol dehydrogenase family)